MKKKLIVDVGRFAISYSVINELDLKLEYFKIEMMADIDYLFTKRGTSFIAKIVDVTRSILSSYDNIDKIIFVIPSKDILMVSNSPLNSVDVLHEVEKEYSISSGLGLNQSLAEPYKHKNKYYTPVSLYDNNLDILIKELNIDENFLNATEANKLRSDIYFQTTLGRLIEKAKTVRGKVALVDSGFTSTKVLLSDDGVPVSYREFPILSGERMLQYVYSKTDKKIQEIVNTITNSKNLRGNNLLIIQLADEFVEENAYNFRDYINKFELDEIYIYGGLNALDIVGPTDVPVIVPEIQEGYQDTVPAHFTYKVVYNATTVETNSILDPKNLDVIMGNSEYKDVVGIVEEEEIIKRKSGKKVSRKPQNELIQDDETDVNIGFSGENHDFPINIQESELDLREVGSSKTKKKVFGKNKVEEPTMTEDMLEILEKDSKIKKMDIGTIEDSQEKTLDTLKKKQKKYSKRESRGSMVLIAVLMGVLLLAIIFFMNMFGWVSINALETFGVITPDRQMQVDTYTSSMTGHIRNLGNKFNLNDNRVPIQTSYNKKSREVNITIGVPLDYENNESFVRTIKKTATKMTLDNPIEVEEAEDGKGIYTLVNIKHKLIK